MHTWAGGRNPIWHRSCRDCPRNSAIKTHCEPQQAGFRPTKLRVGLKTLPCHPPRPAAGSSLTHRLAPPGSRPISRAPTMGNDSGDDETGVERHCSRHLAALRGPRPEKSRTSAEPYSVSGHMAGRKTESRRRIRTVAGVSVLVCLLNYRRGRLHGLARLRLRPTMKGLASTTPATRPPMWAP